jgi:FAD/FMN-containing dehydrogenase/Fe-S oxidoreductase
MKDTQINLAEDLRGLIEGDVLTSAVALSAYASDSSLHEVMPAAVVCPRHEDDVVNLVRFATEREIPMIARGSGTGLAGGAIGPGIIIDFARHMNKILEINEEFAIVQPGVLLSDLNNYLVRWGRYFPPDPAKYQLTTIGGMMGVDSAGSHAIRVGSTRDYIQYLNMVLSGGQKVQLGRESIQASTLFETSPRSEQLNQQFDFVRNLNSRVVTLLSANEPLIQKYQPPLTRNTCGYFLNGVLHNEIINYPKMLVGSEGTLGLFTQAKLTIADIPENRSAVILMFPDLQSAIEAVQTILASGPSACDLLDRRVLSLAREGAKQFEEMIPPNTEAALIVEHSGFNVHQARDRLLDLISILHKQFPKMTLGRIALKPEEIRNIWALPQAVVPYLSRIKGTVRPVPIIEDISIPPAQLSSFLKQSQKVQQRHGITASLYAHAASGQIHLRPFISWPQHDGGRQIEALARDIYQVVFDHGGSMSGEHGDGYSRTAFVRSQYGPLYRVFQQLKNIFDPPHLMNPEKIISDDPTLTRRHFRSSQFHPLTETNLHWQEGELAIVTSDCNGCGGCRTLEPGLRMCPFYRLTPNETSSPRAKANVFRNILLGQISKDELAGEQMQELSKQCFNCKQCQIECPSHVNIPDLVTEAKAAYVSAHGLTRSQWLLSRLEGVGRFACNWSWLVNWTLRRTSVRWLLDKVFGLSRYRSFPRFVKRPFLADYEQQKTPFAEPAPSDRERIVYFVDYFANYHDPALAKAFIEIMQRNNIPVVVPYEQQVSGMAMIGLGDLDPARKIVEHNVRLLAPFAREGYRIVCTEPSAAICLKMEYPRLSTHPDVHTIGRQTMEAGEYLKHLSNRGMLDTDFMSVPRKSAYHLPCHVRALSGQSFFAELMKNIPDLQFQLIDRGCSGMAGPFGLATENYETSLKIAEPLLETLRNNTYDDVAAECSSCRMQISQGSNHHTLHPIKLLAMAYGIDVPDMHLADLRQNSTHPKTE